MVKGTRGYYLHLIAVIWFMSVSVFMIMVFFSSNTRGSTRTGGGQETKATIDRLIMFGLIDQFRLFTFFVTFVVSAHAPTPPPLPPPDAAV